MSFLVVGEIARWQASGRWLPGTNTYRHAEFHELDRIFDGSEAHPDIVLSPLVCPSFDCLDLAALLHGVEFCGRYRAMAPDLPNPGMILGEIRSLFPGLDFDILPLHGRSCATLN